MLKSSYCGVYDVTIAMYKYAIAHDVPCCYECGRVVYVMNIVQQEMCWCKQLLVRANSETLCGFVKIM